MKTKKTAAPAVGGSSKLANIRRVCELTSLSRTSVYLMVGRGEFPAPVQLGKRRVAWREADVIAWLESRKPVTWAA